MSGSPSDFLLWRPKVNTRGSARSSPMNRFRTANLWFNVLSSSPFVLAAAWFAWRGAPGLQGAHGQLIGWADSRSVERVYAVSYA
mgnify:FL=1